MYSSHPDLPDIDDATSLWRYIDLYKYLDLLQTAELHLTRADQMEDRWEGAYSNVNVAARPDLYAEHWEMMSKTMPLMYQYARTHTYLNCWYMGDAQSYAMWKLYDAAGKGVAIRTTTGTRLKSALVGDHRPALSGASVQYVDYHATFIPEGNMFFPYIHKPRRRGCRACRHSRAAPDGLGRCLTACLSGAVLTGSGTSQLSYRDVDVARDPLGVHNM